MQRRNHAPAVSSLTLAYALAVTLVAVSLAVLARAGLYTQLPCLAFLAFVIYAKAPAFRPAALLLFFLYVSLQFFPDFLWSIPTAAFFLPLLLAALLSYPSPGSLAAWLSWLRKGRGDLELKLTALVTVFLSAAALLFWAMWSNNLGAGAQVLMDFRGVSPWFLYIVAVPAFALLNAAAEEAIFRGVLLTALLEGFARRPWLANAIVSVSFGAAHYWSGFPNGSLGFVMTFVYSLVLGHLRIRSRGILLPFLTHVAADLVIGYLLLLLAR